MANYGVRDGIYPLEPIKEDELAYWFRMDRWTMGEAMYLMSGHRPVGYDDEDTALQDHFMTEYGILVNSITAVPLTFQRKAS